MPDAIEKLIERMPLSDLTEPAVQQAIAEFDELGRANFLKTYGFKKSRDYILMHKGRPYDSKAIAGVAHRYLPGGKPLSSSDFSGGEKAAAGKLRELGFDVPAKSKLPVAPIPTFEPGAVYNRVRDIHMVYGGQRQGGISTPKQNPLIFLFTGETGGQYGYRDGPRADGIFAYTGEGQVGPMKFVRGNLAVRDQVKNGLDLLLFETLKKKGSYRFIGYFACDGFEYGMGPDRKESLRQTIIFHLRPAASGEEPEIIKATSRLSQLSLDELRRRAIEDANEKPDRKQGKRPTLNEAQALGLTCSSEPPEFVRVAQNPRHFSNPTASHISNRIIHVGSQMVDLTIRAGLPQSVQPVTGKSTTDKMAANATTA